MLLEGDSSGIKGGDGGSVLINTVSSCWMRGAEVSASGCWGGEWAETGATEGQRLPTERRHNLHYITDCRRVKQTTMEYLELNQPHRKEKNFRINFVIGNFGPIICRQPFSHFLGSNTYMFVHTSLLISSQQPSAYTQQQMSQ